MKIPVVALSTAGLGHQSLPAQLTGPAQRQESLCHKHVQVRYVFDMSIYPYADQIFT